MATAPKFVRPTKSVFLALVCASRPVSLPAAAQTAVVAPVPALVARVATRPLKLVLLVCPIARMVSAATRTTAALHVAAPQVRFVRVASV